MQKINLAGAFATISDHWKPRLAGEVNGTAIKLVKFSGAFGWHHHEVEDELFLVVSGRLRMHLESGAIDLDAGELIIVPRMVAHCPEALTDECSVLLVEPVSTLNTGNVRNDRTVSTIAPLTHPSSSQ